MKLNNIDLILKVDGQPNVRRNLVEFVRPDELGKIKNVCVIPPEIAAMSLLVPGTNRVSNFKLYEFLNKAGETKIHPAQVIALQATRDDLNERLGGRIAIFHTCFYRSPQDNYRLAVTQGLGWTDEGGRVSRNSIHQFGAASDFHAFDWKRGARVPKKIVKEVAELYFDYVQQYPDTQHTHGDVRYQAGIMKK